MDIINTVLFLHGICLMLIVLFQIGDEYFGTKIHKQFIRRLDLQRKRTDDLMNKINELEKEIERLK